MAIVSISATHQRSAARAERVFARFFMLFLSSLSAIIDIFKIS